MQSSIWKLITAGGIIGIGTLVVLEVQQRLPSIVPQTPPAENSTEPQQTAFVESDVVPDATTEFDLLFSDLGEPTSEDAGTAGSAARSPATDASPAIAHNSTSEIRHANLLDDDNPFAVFDSQGDRQPSPVTTSGSQTSGSQITQASYEQRADAPSSPFTPDDDAGDEVALPSFDEPGAAESGEPAAPFEPDPTNGDLNSEANTAPLLAPVTAAAPPTRPATDDSDSEPPFFSLDTQSNSTEPNGTPAEAPSRPPGNGSPDNTTKPAALPDESFFTPDIPAAGDAPRPALPLLPTPDPAGRQSTQPAPAQPDIEFFTPDDAGEKSPRPAPAPARPLNQPTIDDLDSAPLIGTPGAASPGNGTGPGRTLPAPRPDAPPDMALPIIPEEARQPSRDLTPPLDISSAPFEADREAVPLFPSNGSVEPIGTEPAGAGSDIVTASATLSDVLRPNLTISKHAPQTATVGVPIEYTVEVTNNGQSDAFDVIVEDSLPAAAQLVMAQPVPEYSPDDRLMTWQLPKLAAGETRTMNVRITPTGEGTLDGVATVRFKAQVRSQTVITAPKLKLSISGPSEVRMGEEVSFRFVVKNEGTGDANDVILRNILPAGLQHPEGSDLEYDMQTLRSGEERDVTLAVTAAEPGEFSNKAEVTSAGVAGDSAALNVTIVGAQLRVERLGPERRYVGRTARCQNVVSNDTVFDAANAVVIERVPEGMKFISAGQNGEFNPAERLITWQIPSVQSGKQVLLDVELEPERPGEIDTVVEVIEQAGFRSRATRTILVDDLHNVSADISRLEGPVAVGEKFGFSIVIDNRGTAIATNVKLAVEVPAQVTVLAAGSREVTATRSADNVVRYASVIQIRPGEKKTFQITLQGGSPVQNALIKAEVNYDGMPQPLIVSESVTVYSDSL